MFAQGTPISSQPMPQAQTPFSAQQGVNSVKQGYQNALGSLQQGFGQANTYGQQALQASNNTTSGEQMQLGNTLAQQQSSIGQNLTNRGLGNTTVAATATQAPMEAYNTAMANVANQGAIRQMGAYNNLAGLSAQGGQAFAQNQSQGGQAAGNMMNQYALGAQQQQNQQNSQVWNGAQGQQNANNNAYQMSMANAFQHINDPSSWNS